MAAILQFRRGATVGTLTASEPFLNTTNNSVIIGTDSSGSTITLAHLDTANTGSLHVTGDITGSNAFFSGNIDLNGDIFVGGNLYLGDAPLDIITINASLSGSLIPVSGSAFDIGTSTKKWSTIYADSAVIGSVTASSVPYSGITGLPTLVSGSSQIDHDATTNFVADEHINHSTLGITAGLGMSGGGILTNTRTITLSTGSLHFTDGVVEVLDANVVHSGSFLGTATTANLAENSANLYYTDARVKTKLNTETVISSSAQLTTEFDARYLNTTADSVVSGSSQISFNGITDKPTLVSGSSQIDLTATTNYISGIKTRLNAESVISGSGTTNYLPKFTGNTALGNSVIYDDGTNIGIGTTSPTEKLTIANGSLFLDPGRKLIWDTNEYIIGDSSNDGSLRFFTAGSEKFVIESGGNVGIGTISPSYKLDVVGQARVTGQFLRVATAGSSGGLYISGNVGDGYFGVAQATNGLLTGTVAGDTVIRGSQKLVFGINGVGKMTMDSSGNVGIGTTTPGAKLDIHETGNSGNQIRIYDDEGVTPAIRTYSTSDGYGLILNSYYAVAGSPYTRYSDLVASSGGTEATEMRFFTKTLSSNPSEAMRIDSSGNVGIGTTNPTSNLEISGASPQRLHVTDTTYTVTTQLNSEAGYGWVGTKTNDTFHIGTGDSAKITILSAGNVGIGTTTPSVKLDVNGDAVVSGSLTVTGTLTAQEFHSELVSSSIIYESGSTKFGDTADDLHEFTGSVEISGSVSAYDELILKPSIQSFGESYMQNYRSKMLDLGAEYFPNTGGYEVGKLRQLDINPTLLMLPAAASLNTLHAVGSDRTKDFSFTGGTADRINVDGDSVTVVDGKPRVDYRKKYVAPTDTSYYLDGYSTLSGTIIFGGSDFSLFFKVYVLGSTRVILTNGASNALELEIQSDNTIVGFLNGTGALTASTGTIIPNSINTIGYSKVGATGTYYINGVAAGTTADSYNYFVKQDTLSHSSLSLKRLYISEFWNVGLSATEMLDRHNRVAIDPKYVGANNVTLTAGSFTIGKQYRIVTIGTTDFTLIDAASNTVGVEFKATGVGTGTGTATSIGNTLNLDGGKTDIGTTEFITALNDRDFSSGTIGNWYQATDGTGTFTYDGTNPAGEKVGKITGGGGTYNVAKLNTTEITTFVDGKSYIIKAKLYVPNANTSKTVKVGVTSVTNPGSTSKTLVGDTWTEIQYFYTAGAVVIGALLLGFDTDGAGGDIVYYDDISVVEVSKWYDKDHSEIADVLAPLQNPNGFPNNIHGVNSFPTTRLEPACTNYFLNSATPVTQTIATTIGTTYTLIGFGKGLATVEETGGNGRGGIVTDVDHFTYKATTTSITVTIVSGFAGGFNFTNTDFPVRLIRTAGSSVAKTADLLSESGLQSKGILGATEGTLFIDFGEVLHNSGGNSMLLLSTVGSWNDSIGLWGGSNNTFKLYIAKSSTLTLLSSDFGGSDSKILISYNSTTIALTVNGVNIIEVANTDTQAFDQIKNDVSTKLFTSINAMWMKDTYMNSADRISATS